MSLSVAEPLVLRDDHLAQEHIVRLTLNHPAKRNALSAAMLRALAEAVEGVAPDEASIIILRAAGPAFSAGHDLNEILHGTDDEVAAVFEACEQAMQAIRQASQIVVAEVQGIATAAGCQLVATCDLAVAASSARFATPGVRIGYFCVSPGVALSRNVGVKAAAAMLFTGEPVTAAEALAAGLVNRVVPAEAVEDASLAMARSISRFSRHVLAHGKQHFYAQLAMSYGDALSYASGVMVAQRAMPDAHEGMAAFLSKRDPTWLS
ncbi:MAG: enoyl-CoA hydratase-related protein [Thermaerobacter sp.]|nr:enoyl-CoA hydratase-related protein [Thermaerobacter sp.]